MSGYGRGVLTASLIVSVLAVGVSNGVIRFDFSGVFPKTQRICVGNTCSIGIANPLGRTPSVSDFFSSIAPAPSPFTSSPNASEDSAAIVTQSGQCDEHGQNCVTYPPYTSRPIPTVPKAGPKQRRADQLLLPNNTGPSNQEPQVFYMPIPVPVEMPPIKQCI